MSWQRWALAGVLLLPACSGSDALEDCVQHSVEEGVDEQRARTACESVVERR